MGIPQGTMLARASREHWTRRIQAAKSIARPLQPTIVPACEAAALTMQARAERHVGRMAAITEKVLPHLETMQPADILENARNLERFDFVARRNYGLEQQQPGNGPVNVAILTNRAAIEIIAPPRIGETA